MTRRIILQFEAEGGHDERLFIQLSSAVYELRQNDKLVIEDFNEMFHVIDLTVEEYITAAWVERARWIFDESTGTPGPAPGTARVERS